LYQRLYSREGNLMYFWLKLSHITPNKYTDLRTSITGLAMNSNKTTNFLNLNTLLMIVSPNNNSDSSLSNFYDQVVGSAGFVSLTKECEMLGLNEFKCRFARRRYNR
jgi:hypothetical protein